MCPMCMSKVFCCGLKSLFEENVGHVSRMLGLVININHWTNPTARIDVNCLIGEGLNTLLHLYYKQQMCLALQPTNQFKLK